MVSKVLYKASIAAHYISEHPGATRRELIDYLIEEGMLPSYTRKTIAVAKNNKAIRTDERIILENTRLYPGENIEQFLQIYSTESEYYRVRAEVEAEKQRSYMGDNGI